MEKSIIIPYASQPRIVLAAFECNTPISDFPRRLQCLVPPTALSTGRRWNTPRDAAANWCQRFDLRVWPRHKNCLLMSCRRTITASSSIAPSMLLALLPMAIHVICFSGNLTICHSAPRWFMASSLRTDLARSR